MGFCDPLTRTCIDACVLAILCLDGATPICVEGGCYECGSAYDCGAGICDPFDRSCRACAGNNECEIQGHYCDPVGGSCWACLNDGHCQAGQFCRPTDRICVQCLKNSDCKDAGKPVCGKSGSCLPACSNECANGNERCDPADADNIQTCADFDDDPCTEWGYDSYCGTASVCSGGGCVCQNECSNLNYWACDSSTNYKYWTCEETSAGCRYYDYHLCPSPQICHSDGCY
jgi:hypothetical protein